MTIILTHISNYGIIHASDSNLTARTGRAAGESQKTFKIKHLDAGLTVAGAYSVGGLGMDRWMATFIQQAANARNPSLSAFAYSLRDDLEAQMTPDEKAAGSMVHIAGYEHQADRFHPEFWFVRNVTGIDLNTGEYTGTSTKFTVSEDFWTRDCPNSRLMEAFQQGVYWVYVNGFASGRIGFVALQRVMGGFFRTVWSNPNWRFRAPRSIEETQTLVRLNIQIIGTLFQLSDYPAPFVGGQVQTLVIPQPPHTATHSPVAH